MHVIIHYMHLHPPWNFGQYGFSKQWWKEDEPGTKKTGGQQRLFQRKERSKTSDWKNISEDFLVA